jgi:amidase
MPGSIRSPAANCGIYGFKPTAFRIPTDGWCSTAAGADPIPGVIGPLSTTLSGLKLFMKTIIDAKPWLVEPALIPLLWNLLHISPSSSKPLRIGVMYNDGVVTPHPPITRALKTLVASLEKLKDVEVMDWKPHLHDEAWAILSSLYFTDGGVSDIAILTSSGEAMLPLTSWMLKENPCVKKLTPQKLYYWQEEREAYRKEYANLWNERGVDVILCPVGPGVAPKHNTAKYWGYTAQWNLLDYPAVSFPIGRVEKEKDGWEEGWEALTDVDRQNFELCEFLFLFEIISPVEISLLLLGVWRMLILGR